MLRLIGAMLLVGGGTILGLGAAEQLRARVHCLRSLVSALELMDRELSFRLTSMPELLSELADRCGAPAGQLFACCGRRMGELSDKSFGTLWREALEEVALPLEEERGLVEGLGDVLGRYDAQGQRTALQELAAELRICLHQAEGEGQRLGRVYTALGAGAGTVLMILLI